ncbi:MAG: DUF402 domain-containing protein [Erysipelotrichaceae bacterium]|nr:DUF402 domain-containing protein [Erysipelotrichaceae bacterium]
MLPQIKEDVFIQSFKHDKSLHRTWSKGFVIESNAQQIVAVTNKTWVIEADGRKWYTREPAICFFYPDCWFNIITMIRKTGVYYYCNLASPSLYDGEAIKNIDYDLDIKLYPNGSYEILDEDEYLLHSRYMHYSNDIKVIIEAQMKELIRRIEQREDPFNDDCVEKYYSLYQRLQRQIR